MNCSDGRMLNSSLFPLRNPSSICDSAEQMVKALLGLPLAQLSDKELTRRPNAMAVGTLQKICKVQGEAPSNLDKFDKFQKAHRETNGFVSASSGPYWKCLEKPNYHLMECSHFEALTSKVDKSATFPSRHFR